MVDGQSDYAPTPKYEVVICAFKSTTREAEAEKDQSLCESKASLLYIASSMPPKGYIVRSCLKN